MVNELIECGANVNQVNEKGFAPLHFTAASRHGALCLELLVGNGADVNIKVRGLHKLHFSDILHAKACLTTLYNFLYKVWSQEISMSKFEFCLTSFFSSSPYRAKMGKLPCTWLPSMGGSPDHKQSFKMVGNLYNIYVMTQFCLESFDWFIACL